MVGKSRLSRTYASMKMLFSMYMNSSCSSCSFRKAISILEKIGSMCLRMTGKQDFEAVTDPSVCYQVTEKNYELAMV